MTKLTTCVLTTTLLFGMGTAYASNLDLEPCMNGAVSASGTFPTQEAENRFHALAAQEPCINGDVPPDGVLATSNASGDLLTSTP